MASAAYFAAVVFADDRALGLFERFLYVVGIWKDERLSFVCDFLTIEQQTNIARIVRRIGCQGDCGRPAAHNNAIALGKGPRKAGGVFIHELSLPTRRLPSTTRCIYVCSTGQRLTTPKEGRKESPEIRKPVTGGQTSPESLVARGKELRKKVARSSHATWSSNPDRPNPIEFLKESSVGRLSNLIPIRYHRMKKSAFTFLRGFPSMMAYDLGTGTSSTQVIVQSCGDCHLENFGIFATPERNVVFDINDFDETLPAPWEWDVKRLAVSIHVAAKVNELSEKRASRAVRAAVSAYRNKIRACSEMTGLEVWYSRVDATDVLEQTQNAELRRATIPGAAPDDTHELIAEQYTEGNGLGRRIADKPPKLFHPPPDREVIVDAGEVFELYQRSLRDDLQVLFGPYQLVDLAIKVVGLGSVGTRCAVALLMASENDALILQIKEARPSILEPYAGASKYENSGQRVIAGQLLMQVASDIFLGWCDSADGHHFYVRQLSDMKGSADVSIMGSGELSAYAGICGETLAVAHARSGQSALIGGYLGSSSTFDRAIARFARSYSDQVREDYEMFMTRIEDGSLPTEPG